MLDRLGSIIAPDWRGRMSIALAHEEELAAYGSTLAGEPDDVVIGWHIIALRVRSDQGAEGRSLRLLG